MPRVICTLENASEEISGWRFTADRGQMVSEDLPDDVAARFASIPGYRLVAPPPPADTAPPPTPPTPPTPPPAETPLPAPADTVPPAETPPPPPTEPPGPVLPLRKRST